MRTFTTVILSIVLITLPFIKTIAQDDENKSGWVEQGLYFDGNTKGILKIEVVDKDTLWVLAFDSITKAPVLDFARSIDGGENWTKGEISGWTDYVPYDLSAVNQYTAWVVMAKSDGDAGIFMTEDGGATWEQQTSAVFDTESGIPVIIRMFDDNEGFCVTEKIKIYRTADGGETWTTLTGTAVPELLANEESMSRVVSVFGDKGIFGTTEGRVFTSNDKGLNWSAVKISDGIDGEVLSLSLASASMGVAIVNSGDETDWGMYRTANGGETWTKNNIPVDYQNSTQVCIIAAGGANYMYYTIKNSGDNLFSSIGQDVQGRSWRPVDKGFEYTYIAVISDTIGWVGAYSSTTSAGIRRIADVPVLKTTPVLSIKDNEYFEYEIEAEDPNDLPLIITASTQPNWASFVDNGDGTAFLEGQPYKIQPGSGTSTASYRIGITISNGTRVVTNNFDLVVSTANLPPVFISTPVLTGMAHQAYYYKIEAEDPDGDTLNFSSINKPSWLGLIDNGDGTALIGGAAMTPQTASIKIQVADKFYKITQEFTLTILPYNDVEDFGFGTISVYPNPTANYIKVENCQGAKYEILDIRGKVLREGSLTQSNEMIDISDLSKGNLLIKLFNDDNIYTTKIVKI